MTATTPRKNDMCDIWAQVLYRTNRGRAFRHWKWRVTPSKRVFGRFYEKIYDWKRKKVWPSFFKGICLYYFWIQLHREAMGAGSWKAISVSQSRLCADPPWILPREIFKSRDFQMSFQRFSRKQMTFHAFWRTFWPPQCYSVKPRYFCDRQIHTWQCIDLLLTRLDIPFVPLWDQWCTRPWRIPSLAPLNLAISEIKK